MTPDQALRCIEQERLDVLAEGQTEADCNMIAAYVLASAYRKLLMRLDGPSGGDSGSVGPWKECVYKHPDAVPSIRVDPAYLLKLEANAARYLWWRSKWSADSDEAIDDLNEALDGADTAEKIDAAMDAAITGTPATTLPVNQGENDYDK